MKFSFDIEDIDEIAEEWLRILVANQETNKAIDASDCRYISELMLNNPKMERLMPCIIKELLGYYKTPLREEF